jgi:hypothetical protein
MLPARSTERTVSLCMQLVTSPVSRDGRDFLRRTIGYVRCDSRLLVEG